MNTFDLSFDVPDREGAVAFYRELLGVEPAKRKPGDAKFEVADPPLVLAMRQARMTTTNPRRRRQPVAPCRPGRRTRAASLRAPSSAMLAAARTPATCDAVTTA